MLGPRQVGKSTLLRALSPNLTIDLASPTTFRDYVAQPERFEREMQGASRSVHTVMIDEIQKVPALLDGVQSILDAHPRRFRFLLSGSSARKLRRGQANLLPGRVVLEYLHPLLARELGGDFRVERALAHGTLPGIYSEPDAVLREQILRSYADAYLLEEVQAEALVRDIGGYARLLDLVAASSGRSLNLHALSREAGMGYETARRYIVAHPKILLFDVGVRNALLRRPLDRALDDERGLLLEHLVGLELARRTTGLWPGSRLFHFRTRHGAGLDYVVEVGREVWAIEVKASGAVDMRDLRGFQALAERTKRLKRRIVVFTGPRRQKLAEVEALPVEEFLHELPV